MIRTIEGGPPISETDIDQFETQHGLTLPVAYRSFLLRCNGGRPERDLFNVPGCSANPIARIHFFFGIGDPVASSDLDWNATEYADRIPTDLLPIATTEGADKICLEIGASGSGRVIYWDGYGNEGQKLFPVASGFEDFLRRLFTDENSPTLD